MLSLQHSSIEGTTENVLMELITARAYRNQGYIGENVKFIGKIPIYLQDILFDPRISGRLLISVEKAKVEELLNYINSVEYPNYGYFFIRFFLFSHNLRSF